MYGKSWGGFNGLQVAFNKPPSLSAVISLYSTDDRYEDDIHWKGGCILGGGMLSWASVMFCWDARPPHPRYNDQWQQVWRQRLETAGESCVARWTEHQVYDEYWRHGSVRENYDNIQIPVLAIGGWHDGYTNAAMRMSQSLPNCRALIGPWSHNWPDTAVPGPNIAFMDECLQFWDEHLKGVTGRVTWLDTPRVRWYQCNGTVSPGPTVSSWPGVWQSGDTPGGDTNIVYHLADNNKLDLKLAMSDSVSVPFSG